MAVREIAMRLDTEDPLTAESDDALSAILDALDRHGFAATFAVTADKVRSWLRRGRHDLIRRLADGRHAIGYHSDTHSLHPTIAEALAPLDWRQGREAFAEREAEGFALVRDTFGPPACYTQPGGNWTAAGLAVLREWGVPMEFSESWNSYLDHGAEPCWYAGILHWSPPVRAPKPFLSALPEALPAALEDVRGAPEGGPPACVVAHPTELCTTAFWDAVNFARGRMPRPRERHPAPLRTPAAIAAAAAAFDTYLSELESEGWRSCTAAQLRTRHPDRSAGVRLPAAALPALAGCVRDQAAHVSAGGLTLSAAEVFGVLCAALAAGTAQPVPVRYCDGPPGPPPTAAVGGGAPRAALVLAARWCDRFIDRRGHLPGAVPVGGGAVAPADFLCAAAHLLSDPSASQAAILPRRLHAVRYVKSPGRLHWDWPIFREGFSPLGLWEQALLQAWTLKPAPPAAAPILHRWAGPPAGA